MPADRDVLRRKTPPAGVAQQIAAPVAEIEEVTGRYTGVELDVRRLERWRDQVTPVIHATGAKVDTLLDYAAKSDAERERRAARDAEERERKAQADAKALEGRRRHTIALVTAVGIAIAGIVAAVVR